MHTNEALRNELITAFSTTVELFGLTTLESRLFAYLYLENNPQTLDDMSEALGKSKTAMSTSIRSLANLNLVSQVWRKGERRDLYVANRQIYKLFMNFYFRKWVDKTEQQKGVVKEVKEKAQTQLPNNKETDDFLDKADEIITFHCQIEDVFSKIRDGDLKNKT
jgi:DNA-binding transcriptional regulator GbsR (MarR family)